MASKTLSTRACVACLVTWAGFGSFTSAATASEVGLRGWLPGYAETPAKLVPVRKLARKLLHLGSIEEDERPIQLGPAAARLFWQKKWKWPVPAADQNIACGLLGGPMLSVGLPLRALGQLFSIETRLSSFRYADADLQSKRTVIDELSSPQQLHQSLEGGIYFTMPLLNLF
jgi:hypothetical protein